jgi:hypothetical protein
MAPAAWGRPLPDRLARCLSRPLEPDPRYDWVREAVAASLDLSDLGDPKAVGPALQQIVDAENPPLRVFFGKLPGRVVKDHYARKLAEWTDWEHVAHAAHGCPAQSARSSSRRGTEPALDLYSAGRWRTGVSQANSATSAHACPRWDTGGRNRAQGNFD